MHSRLDTDPKTPEREVTHYEAWPFYIELQGIEDIFEYIRATSKEDPKDAEDMERFVEPYTVVAWADKEMISISTMDFLNVMELPDTTDRDLFVWYPQEKAYVITTP